MKLQLRDYQTEALCVLLEYAKRFAGENDFSPEPALSNNDSRRLLCIQPTGAGKTVLILAFAAEVRRRHSWKTLLVVPSRELLAQSAARAKQFFPDLRVSQIGNNSFDLSGDFVVATSASLTGNKLRKIATGHFSAVICDEAHHAAADSYREMLDYFAAARMRIGVTATHIRGDGENVASAAYFPIVAVWNTVSQLVRAGFLVPAYGFRVSTETSLENLAMKNDDFNERELSKTVNNPARNQLAVAAYFEHLQHRPTVCFTVDVAHAQDLAHCFNQHNVRAEAVWGAMKPDDYAQIMKRFANCETQVLVNAKLLVEGWDCPQVSGVILARPATKTSAAVLGPQMIGRALRPCESAGKVDAVIVELRDDSKDCDNVRGEFRSMSLLESMAETNEDNFSSTVPLHEQADFNRACAAWKEREKLRNRIFGEEAATQSFDVIEEIERASRYAWVALGDVLYMPLTGGEFIEIVALAPAYFEIRGCLAGDFHVIGTAVSRAAALAAADAWLSVHAAARQLILRDQPWRTRAATEKQILRAAELTGLSVMYLSDLTSGAVSDLIRSAYALSLSPEEIVFARLNLNGGAVSRQNPHSWQIAGSRSS